MKKTAIYHCPERIRSLAETSLRIKTVEHAPARTPRKTATATSFKAKLRQQGKTVRQWAVDNGFPPNAVYRTLNGLEKGNFGQSHAILVAAGIKQPDAEPLAA